MLWLLLLALLSVSAMCSEVEDDATGVLSDERTNHVLTNDVGETAQASAGVSWRCRQCRKAATHKNSWMCRSCRRQSAGTSRRRPTHRSWRPTHRSRRLTHRSWRPTHRSRRPTHRSRRPTHRSRKPSQQNGSRSGSFPRYKDPSSQPKCKAVRGVVQKVKPYTEALDVGKMFVGYVKEQFEDPEFVVKAFPEGEPACSELMGHGGGGRREEAVYMYDVLTVHIAPYKPQT